MCSFCQRKLSKPLNSYVVPFYGRGEAGCVHRAKVSWELVCRPKKEGGLGIKRVVDWNTACLARIIWLLFRGSNSLWIACIHTWLLKSKSFWSVTANSSCSWSWRRLLKLRTMFRPMIFHEVGNGGRTYL